MRVQVLAGIVAFSYSARIEAKAMRHLEIFVYAVCVSLILKGGITPEFKAQFRILTELIVYAWCIGTLNVVFCGGALRELGIRPRTSLGLLGILTAPFLHSSWEHLAGNTVPFFILGWFVMLGGIQNFFIVTIFVALFSGIAVWLLGQSYTNHAGASGVIFGYLGFLLVRSYFVGDSLSIVLTVLVGFLYGRILWGICPEREGISWEGHLFGLLGGVIAAGFLDVLQAMFPASIT